MTESNEEKRNPLDKVEPFINIPTVETKSEDMKGKGEKR